MSTLRVLLVVLAVGALAGAIAIPFVLSALRRRTGFDFGAESSARLIASDVGIGPALILRDDDLGLCGKPDYLLEMNEAGERRFVPVEVKPARQSQRLFDSDRIQIGAYLMALRATMGNRASHIGYVRYRTRTFEVALSPDLEQEVRQLVAALRRGRTARVVHRSHSVSARCRACPVRQHCDEALSR